VLGSNDGTWKTGDYFGHMNDDSVQMAPFTNMPADVAAKANEIKDAIEAGEYFAFTGPLKDNTGKIQLKAGEVADDVHLNTMMYYVEGINAKYQETKTMIPVIDFKSETVLDEIREAYTTVGFAVFTNTLNNTRPTNHERLV
jgi:basic membrane lipoprotein Med (substrate-binding protein (PBP1-ABC) superfamily)